MERPFYQILYRWLFTLGIHRCLQLGGSFLFGLREQMAVLVERELNAGMPHLIADVLWVFALRDEHRSKEVSEIMESDAIEPGSGDDRSVYRGVEVIR
jgi:hypothetical protein